MYDKIHYKLKNKLKKKKKNVLKISQVILMYIQVILI